MGTGSRRRHLRLLAVCLPAALLLAACEASSPSILEPAGPGARRIEGLWWILFWVAGAVFLVVLALMAIALWRARRTDASIATHVGWGEPFIVVAGVALPALILGAVFLVSLGDLAALSNDEGDDALTIEVVGKVWWWEARYPNGAVTANEIHVPVGEPVELELTTTDVIHSFWVPRLQAKVDMIPGRVNRMSIQADEPGRYRGQCAEFCGLQHANMAFYVVAEPPQEFEEWVAMEAAPADEPVQSGAARGRDVFLGSTCAGCHAIRGTPASAELGPDLTHLDARATIGAGLFANTRANLARFIVDPQEVKPGITMPPTELTAAELDALLDYLEQLD